MNKEIICINCPMGCRMSVELEHGAVRAVTGNTCARGERYARDEAVHPRRMVTALAPVLGRTEPLPVKTAAPIGKELIPACLAAIRAARVEPPVRAGDAVVRNVCGSGVDVVATAEIF